MYVRAATWIIMSITRHVAGLAPCRFSRLTGSGKLNRETLNLVLSCEVGRVCVVAILDRRIQIMHITIQGPQLVPSWTSISRPSPCLSQSLHQFDIPALRLAPRHWIFTALAADHSDRSVRSVWLGVKQQLQNEKPKCIQESKFGVDWKYNDSHVQYRFGLVQTCWFLHGLKGDDQS